MSSSATWWAMRQTHLPDHLWRLLVILADYAGTDGRHAFPRITVLCALSGKDRRTIQRNLRDLEDRGFIIRGDQAHVAHYPADKRPTVYDLPIYGQPPAPAPEVVDNPLPGAAPVPPRPQTGAAPASPRGAAPVPPPETRNITTTPPTPPAPPTGRRRLRAVDRRPPPKPGWCGSCDERTRQVEDLLGTRSRCPFCHPLSNRTPVGASP